MNKIEQIQCPNCKSYKTTPKSTKIVISSIGFGLVALSGLAFLFSLTAVGVFMLILGFVVWIAGLAKKEEGNMYCEACNFHFKDEEKAKRDAQAAKDNMKFTFKIK